MIFMLDPTVRRERRKTFTEYNFAKFRESETSYPAQVKGYKK